MNRVEEANKMMQKLGVKEKSLAKSFDEFETVKNNFIYGEVWNQGNMDEKLRSIVTVAVLTTVEGKDLEEQIRVALNIGVKPQELLEVFHQGVPYIGFAKAEKGLEILKKVFDEKNILMPLEHSGVVTEENRLEKGISVQKSIFGERIDKMRASAQRQQKIMQDYLSAYCLGDTYTRKVLDLKTRELITFICISALGGCDNQVKSHVGGNLEVGNSKELLISAIYQCLPYIGFPRSLNAISAINEIAK